MKKFVILFFLLLAATIPCHGAPKDDRLAKLEQAFLARRADAKADLDSRLKKLDAGYLGALDRELEKAKASGQLETVLPIDAEINALKAGTDPIPDLGAAAPLETKQLRVKYDEARQKILRANASVLADLADKMEASLSTRETELTKAGKIEDALAAKTLRESLVTDPGIKDARDLLKFGRRVGSRPALVLRRPGDDIEVMVFFDSRGKISMQSPVENVRESTGKGGELGNTMAKVLGEFVGAKGYEVDPFAAYHHVFDTKDLGGLMITEIDHEFRHEEAGRRGLRIAFDPGGKNPHGNFGDILPTTAAPGSFRIEVSYLIPKSNRAIRGFHFVHGIGGPIEGKVFDKKGAWDRAEVLSSAIRDNGSLLLYLQVAEGKQALDAIDDHVVLGELKVELVKTSAFVVKKFGESGGLLEMHADPLKQPRLISNGDFAGE